MQNEKRLYNPEYCAYLESLVNFRLYRCATDKAVDVTREMVYNDFRKKQQEAKR